MTGRMVLAGREKVVKRFVIPSRLRQIRTACLASGLGRGLPGAKAKANGVHNDLQRLAAADLTSRDRDPPKRYESWDGAWSDDEVTEDLALPE